MYFSTVLIEIVINSCENLQYQCQIHKDISSLGPNNLVFSFYSAANRKSRIRFYPIPATNFHRFVLDNISTFLDLAWLDTTRNGHGDQYCCVGIELKNLFSLLCYYFSLFVFVQFVVCRLSQASPPFFTTVPIIETIGIPSASSQKKCPLFYCQPNGSIFVDNVHLCAQRMERKTALFCQHAGTRSRATKRFL